MNMNLKRFLGRKKLLNHHFFDNVCYFDKKTERIILNWMMDLQIYKHISIDKFSYLFSKFEGIVFPIKVLAFSPISQTILVTDHLENEYYMHYNPHEYYKMVDYSIERKKYPTAKEFHYQITSENGILFKSVDYLPLTEDNDYKDDMFTFSYDHKSNMTVTLFTHSSISLEIVYPSQDSLFDDKILMYLFELSNSHTFFDDVFPIFFNISNIGDLPSLSVKSTLHSEILSEICLSDGVVTKYVFTERKSDSEICLHKLSISKDLKEFISEY